MSGMRRKVVSPGTALDDRTPKKVCLGIPKKQLFFCLLRPLLETSTVLEVVLYSSSVIRPEFFEPSAHFVKPSPRYNFKIKIAPNRLSGERHGWCAHHWPLPQPSHLAWVEPKVAINIPFGCESDKHVITICQGFI